jgi:hypothetical protein
VSWDGVAAAIKNAVFWDVVWYKSANVSE